MKKDKKIYRLLSSPFGVLLFPTPVDKQNTFLIKAPTHFHGEIYKYLLDFGALHSPLESADLYVHEGLHRDAKTHVYQLNWNNLKIEFLPQREVDLNRAQMIEGIIQKKFIKLFENPDKKVEMIQDIQHRFKQQQLCSECQKLGINDLEVEKWFQGLQIFSNDNGCT
jgi:hypothetical protein